MAAGVALLAAMIATWQAYEARRSRKTAEDQAAAARAQADAAAEQVSIMRKDRDDRAGPEFSVIECIDSGYGSGETGLSAILQLRMERGPLLASVTVTPHGTRIVGDAVYRDPTLERRADAFSKIGAGAVVGFYIPCRPGFVGSAGAVELTCVEDGGEGRTWIRGVGFTIQRPPRASSYVW